MSPYETHKPVLEYALLKQGRQVLEVGGGQASTPLITSLSKKSITLENNIEYYNQISRYDDGENHLVIHERDLVSRVAFYSEKGQTNEFSLALVDNDVWSERCKIVNLLRNVVEVILLHDSFEEHLGRCQECGYKLPSFRYSFNLFPTLPPNPNLPPTLIMSNMVDVTKWEIPGLTPN